MSPSRKAFQLALALVLCVGIVASAAVGETDGSRCEGGVCAQADVVVELTRANEVSVLRAPLVLVELCTPENPACTDFAADYAAVAQALAGTAVVAHADVFGDTEIAQKTHPEKTPSFLLFLLVPSHNLLFPTTPHPHMTFPLPTGTARGPSRTWRSRARSASCAGWRRTRTTAPCCCRARTRSRPLSPTRRTRAARRPSSRASTRCRSSPARRPTRACSRRRCSCSARRRTSCTRTCATPRSSTRAARASPCSTAARSTAPSRSTLATPPRSRRTPTPSAAPPPPAARATLTAAAMCRRRRSGPR